MYGKQNEKYNIQTKDKKTLNMFGHFKTFEKECTVGYQLCIKLSLLLYGPDPDGKHHVGKNSRRNRLKQQRKKRNKLKLNQFKKQHQTEEKASGVS